MLARGDARQGRNERPDCVLRKSGDFRLYRSQVAIPTRWAYERANLSNLRVRFRHPTNNGGGCTSRGTREMRPSSKGAESALLDRGHDAFSLADDWRFSAQVLTGRRYTTYDNADSSQGSFWQFLGTNPSGSTQRILNFSNSSTHNPSSSSSRGKARTYTQKQLYWANLPVMPSLRYLCWTARGENAPYVVCQWTA